MIANWWTSSSQHDEKSIYKPPGLWYLATAAQGTKTVSIPARPLICWAILGNSTPSLNKTSQPE